MSVHQCHKTKRWYVKYRVDGVQTSKWFGTGKRQKEAAEAFDFDIKALKKRRQELPKRTGVFLDHVAQAYLDDAKMRGASKSFLRDFSNLLNKVFLPALTKKPVEALRYDDILEAVRPFLDRTQSTRNRYLGYLRAVFRFGIAHGLTKNNPLANWKKPKEQPRRSLLTVAGLRKILDSAPEHLKWAIEVEWNLGARPGPSELFALKWEHVNFEEGTVAIYASKTRSWRDVPISADFLARLAARKKIAKSPYVIEYHGHGVRRVNTSWVWAVAEAAKCEPSLLGATLYDIRHLFATTLLNQGADLAAVSSLLGHHSTHMTANQYYHLMAGEKRKAVQKLPSLDQPDPPKTVVLKFKKVQ